MQFAQNVLSQTTQRDLAKAFEHLAHVVDPLIEPKNFTNPFGAFEEGLILDSKSNFCDNS
jgi:CRISPR/Cas system CSM-associated protein Csm2 small subunit